MRRPLFVSLLLCVACSLASMSQAAKFPTTLEDFFLPGSQPGDSGILEDQNKCSNCHGGYDAAVEPHWNWMGSMMAQAARDPLFYACMAVANQDAGDSGDLCIRCHTPKGWLEGRSVPTDGSALTMADREGVQCDFCHKLVKPWAVGGNPYPNDPDYTAGTLTRDQSYLGGLLAIPMDSGNGSYVADNANAKRGPFVDAVARHQMYYSPFHRESALCGTCHDVSNPAFSRQPDGTYAPNDVATMAPSFDKYEMFPVERTFSEWANSDYALLPGGVYAPQFGGNKANVSTCQDCHMPDVTGPGCNKRGAPIRSDLPLHDLTGANTFIPNLVPIAFPGEADVNALQAGVARARAMLKKAASMDLTVTPTAAGYVADVRVINETGHKLPSGYPEGRRLWLNVVALDVNGEVIYESGAYDAMTAVLAHDAAIKVYETDLGMSEGVAAAVGLTPGKSFHFVLNNVVVKDNRIPPRGFTNAAFEAIQASPVGVTYADGQYWDDTQYALPAGTAQVTVTLFYQTVSKEYVEFLRDENVTNDAGQVLYDLWAANGKSAPEAMVSRTVVLQQIVDTQPPTPPTGLAAVATSWKSIDLTWNPATDNVGVTGYEVFRDGARAGSVSGTSFTDNNLAAETTYTYTVYALDAAGNRSDASASASATTLRRKTGRVAAAATRVMVAADVNPVIDRGTNVSFYLPESGRAQLRVVDVAGRVVAELTEGQWDAGHHSVFWNADDVAMGVYMIVLDSSQGQDAKKVTVLR